LTLPERHLGLVPAGEHDALEPFLDAAANFAAEAIDLAALQGLARTTQCADTGSDVSPSLPPLGQRIAVAKDVAFGFAYSSVLEAWHREGAEILPF
jgi:cobyrinic acid a,c-diamide synthase